MLERLDEIKKITVKDILIRQTLENLDFKYFHNRFELEISLAIVLFNMFGDKELITEMTSEGIDWVEFINKNYYLIEELKKGEYGEAYNEIYANVVAGARAKELRSNSIISIFDNLEETLTEENIAKFQNILEKNSEK